MKYNLIIEKVDEVYIGYVPEIPGANTQGATEEEVQENIKEAIRMVLDERAEEAMIKLKDPARFKIRQIEL